MTMSDNSRAAADRLRRYHAGETATYAHRDGGEHYTGDVLTLLAEHDRLRTLARSSDVFAAAARLTTGWCEGRRDHVTDMQDAVVVARAWLAVHPADG